MKSTVLTYFIFLLFLLPCAYLKAQETIYNTDCDTTIYTIVERMPEFPGGDAAMQKFIFCNLPSQVYSVDEVIRSRIVISFIVEKDSTIQHVEVERSLHPDFDKEVVRLVKEMPKWKPGMQNGQAVRVKYTLPLNIRFQ